MGRETAVQVRSRRPAEIIIDVLAVATTVGLRSGKHAEGAGGIPFVSGLPELCIEAQSTNDSAIVDGFDIG